jgi:DNA-binding transcriptional ArsR family regulator
MLPGISAGLRAAAPLFAALGDPTRLDLIDRLCESGPQSITRLAAGSPLTRQAVTKHLHVLRDAGIVRGARRGREQVWQLDPEQLFEARRHLEVISRQWDLALDRLKAFVEAESDEAPQG